MIGWFGARVFFRSVQFWTQIIENKNLSRFFEPFFSICEKIEFSVRKIRDELLRNSPPIT